MNSHCFANKFSTMEHWYSFKCEEGVKNKLKYVNPNKHRWYFCHVSLKLMWCCQSLCLSAVRCYAKGGPWLQRAIFWTTATSNISNQKKEKCIENGLLVMLWSKRADINSFRVNYMANNICFHSNWISVHWSGRIECGCINSVLAVKMKKVEWNCGEESGT